MSGTRFEFSGDVEERAGQQFVSGRGRYGDGYTKIHRIEPHGFASQPVKGAAGLLLSPNGNPDEAYVLGGESAGLRPNGLPAGGTAIYDHNGNIIKLVGEGAVFDFGSRTATFTAGGGWTINGPVTINGNLDVQGNITCSGSNPNHHTH
ncbi:phage baseplate assembly protein [Rhizobium sp. CFBP 8762]|uniref:phage baseplate assembly protein domain-containing protein n=1 Tax=Rhizobium sp. CFBP 8762 TaxID=2775279 RepID=UPI001783B1ED|nr:phage baseplate assembly protein [Rhizobium sp. CFBP 8762]MBD8555560.1 phage baseplate assembly protein [Rhizobium sp. CFBP 8762]